MLSASGARRRGGRSHAEGAKPEDAHEPVPPRAKGISAGMKGAGALILAAAAAALLWPFGHVDKPPRLITPLYPTKKLTALSQFGGTHEEELLWGTYRPQLYFGMRTRRPQSLLAGLMWFDPQNMQEGLQLRHSCEQGDRLSQYGWLRHDGRTYGRQDLSDRDYVLTTTFVKKLREVSPLPQRATSPQPGYGGDWAVRISARRAPGLPSDDPRTISLLFYLADEAGGSMSVHRSTGHDPATGARHSRKGRKDGQLGTGGPVVSGRDAALGNTWALHVADAGMHSVSYLGARTPHTHNLTELLTEHLMAQARRRGQLALGGWLPSSSGGEGPNVVVYQITAALPVTLDIVFATSSASAQATPAGTDSPVDGAGSDRAAAKNSEAANSGDSAAASGGVPPPPPELVGAALDALFVDREAAFEARFEATFPVAVKGGGDGVTGDSSKGAADGGSNSPRGAMLRAAVSNLLGGMGYFYGSSLVRDTEGAPAGGEPAPVLRYWPAPLFTATPSRSFFPRGFLWDEGFHQLLVGRWDPALRREVLAHWLDLMNVDGWIPREQILGAEAARKVPAEFVVQSSGHANPPTLFLPLMAMAERVTSASRSKEMGGKEEGGPDMDNRAADGDKSQGGRTSGLNAGIDAGHGKGAGTDAAAAAAGTATSTRDGSAAGGGRRSSEGRDDDQVRAASSSPRAEATLGEGGDVDKDLEFLRAAFPRLEVWYKWFNTTQRGADARGYMWRGRDPTSGDGRELNAKTLTSGLDDYPRASHPSQRELHVDLWCWMALASRCMASIGRLVGAPARVLAAYEADAAYLADNRALEAVHYDAERGGFFDIGNHTEKVALRRKVLPPQREGDPARSVVVREVTGRPKMRHVPHVGYVTLFPLLMKLLDPQSAPLGQVLKLLGDERQLWSSTAGLRSLSPTSSLYMTRNTEHDPPYWRGPVWVNINYLALGALHHYSRLPGPHSARAGELYAGLRRAMLGNIQECYSRTRYLWEQYGDNGRAEGKGSHPFTGWTALVVLIAADMY